MMNVSVMSEDEVERLGRDPDAGFGALSSARGPLPLTALSIDARVAGVVASIEVTQTFVNTTGGAIEATYIFPLPDRAAVHRFQMEVGGRVIDGVVEERGRAREQYDEAVAQGHRASIAEEERAGVFTLRVGNLLAGETATVRLSLVGPLPVDDGEVTFRFPLVAAPRFIPGIALGGEAAGLGTSRDTTVVPDASRISPPVMLPGCPNPVRLAIRVALEDHAIRDVASSLHAVTTTLRDAHIVEVKPGERLDRDFILRWRVDAAELRSTLVCADDEDGKAGTFALTMMPPSTSTMGAKARDVVIVLDRSGSMSGWKMVAARRAAARMIDTLTSRDRFCVLAFDNVVDRVPEGGLVDATDRARYRAVEALAKVEARGGTELLQPLADAARLLAGGTDDRTRVVVLVTDGQVGNEDHILRELAPSLKNVRVFTLGIDQAVNAAFLRRLAAAGGGLCELVESEDRLDAVMAKVHRRIGTPVATEPALRGVGLDIDATATSPAKLPDVHAGAPVTVLGRYRGSAGEGAAIELTGTTFGEPLRVAITRERVADPAPWLAASWARAAIRDLEDRYAVHPSDEVEAQIVALSTRHGVLSRFTAYLAIDRSEVANKGGRLTQVVQPVEPPAGWDAAAAPMTKTGVLRQASYAMPPSMPAAIPMAAPAPMPGAPPPIVAQGRSYGAPPPAPAKPARARMAPSALREEGGVTLDAAPTPLDAYRASLDALARELGAAARGNVTTLRVLRQRLVEWIEDVRSVGHDALALAVERLVARLSAALAANAQVVDEALAVATELAALVRGAPPPSTSPAPRAFWK